MPRDRDIAAFDARASGYEAGWRGRMHYQIADRTADLAVTLMPAPRRLLDIGCGTGYLLRQLALRCPRAMELVGIDPAPAMIRTAQAAATDSRLRLLPGRAEELPFPAGTFDLVVSSTSFDHWSDQQAGLAQCARVLVPGGWLVLSDVFSAWLRPTLIGRRAHKARTTPRATGLLTAAGFEEVRWHDIYAVVIRAAVARR
jgi:ubiquinone/menaquinone biosynthesis C-methylase UbiE